MLILKSRGACSTTAGDSLVITGGFYGRHTWGWDSSDVMKWGSRYNLQVSVMQNYWFKQTACFGVNATQPPFYFLCIDSLFDLKENSYDLVISFKL